jgi:tetracycline resistance efflux pump
VAINLAGGSGELTSALIPGTIAAVFSGAVFGDHCSPLSDTTIVASIACDIEPLEHVRSQLPYALIAAAVALLIGFIPSGFGLPSWVSLPIGFALLLSLPRLFKAS